MRVYNNHNVYILKHKKSRSIYVRSISSVANKVDEVYLYKPLWDMLRRNIPYCERVRFNQVTKHIARHNLYAKAKYEEGKLKCWRDDWDFKHVSKASTTAELKKKFEDTCKRYLKKGWYVINTKGLDYATFLEYFNSEEYEKELAHTAN